MAEEPLIEITGIEETCRLLQEAPKAAIPGALLRGLAAAGSVIEVAISARVPVRSGALRADLDTTITLDSEFRGGVAAVGFSADQGYKARWVEYGHRMIGHKPSKKDLGTVEVHPFMRPAAASCEEAAVEAFNEGVMAELAQAQIVDSEAA